MPPEHRVKLFRIDRQQILRIPLGYELSGDEVIIRKCGARLIVELAKPNDDLIGLLASWEPLDIEFPDIDTGLPPRDDMNSPTRKSRTPTP